MTEAFDTAAWAEVQPNAIPPAIVVRGHGPLYGGLCELAWIKVADAVADYPALELTPAGVQWLALGGDIREVLAAARIAR